MRRTGATALNPKNGCNCLEPKRPGMRSSRNRPPLCLGSPSNGQIPPGILRMLLLAPLAPRPGGSQPQTTQGQAPEPHTEMRGGGRDPWVRVPGGPSLQPGPPPPCIRCPRRCSAPARCCVCPVCPQSPPCWASGRGGGSCRTTNAAEMPTSHGKHGKVTLFRPGNAPTHPRPTEK